MARAQWSTGQLKLKPELVWSMAVSSLKVRIMRTFLTMLTIATSTAFLIYLLTQPTAETAADRQSWVLMMVLSLSVSAAGVLNTMLMSVTQRYREIGTIKCLGALDLFVLSSVLVESAILGLVGAVAGVLAGFAISILLGMVDHGWGVWGALSLEGWWWKTLVAFGVGMVLTTFGASVPAYIASKMPPMEAMRGEK